MIANLGLTALALAFLSALYAAVVAPLAASRRVTISPAQSAQLQESARHAALITWPLLTLSALSLIVLLVNHHFEVAYVADVTSRAMPTYLRVTAWWGGQAGSLLFWCWLMSSF